MADPRFSIITAACNPPREAFERTAESVLAQKHDSWEWVIVDDASTEARPFLHDLAARDGRIRLVASAEHGELAALNTGLTHAVGELVAFLDPGDALDPAAVDASLQVVDEPDPDAQPVDFCYSDEDQLDGHEDRPDPWLKPDWSPERLRHQAYASHLAVFRRTLVDELGGLRPNFGAWAREDLILRTTERARRIVHVPETLIRRGANAGPAADPEAGIRMVDEHLARVRIQATTAAGATPSTFRIDRVPDNSTPVSIIIPTIGTGDVVWGEHRTLVTECVRSILERSEHESIEFVIVFDPPTPPPVLDELRTIGAAYGVPIRLIAFTEAFNFAAKCNIGAHHATGDVLVFLNDDMEAVSDRVIETLIAPLREDGVGMTGAKLLFENGLIQHGGVLYGDGVIANAYHGAEGNDPGRHGDLTINRECSALTAACIAVRRDVFESVGGFNEALPSSFNDVDLSQKIRAQGLRLLWLHDVVLHHFESISRNPDVSAQELRIITTRWGSYKRRRDRYA